MIKFVEQMLLDAIDAAQSDKVDETFETEVMVDRVYLKDQIEQAVDEFLTGAALSPMPSATEIRNAVTASWNKNFTQEVYKAHFSNIGGNLLDIEFIKGNRTRILFKPNTFGKKPSQGTNFNKLLNIHKNTMGYIMGKVYKGIHKELKFAKGIGSPMSQSKFGKGMRKTKRFAGLHRGKDRSTTAIGGSILNLKGDEDYKERGQQKLNDLLDDATFAREFKGKDFNKAYEAVHKEFTKQFLNNYNIAHFSDLSLEDFKKEFKVKIDYEDVARNPLSKEYDKGALKKYVNQKNLKLTSELQRLLTKAGIDHKTSPSFRQWATKNIPATIAKKIEKGIGNKRLKVKQSGGLDMRFKINQKIVSDIVKYKKTETKKGKTKAGNKSTKSTKSKISNTGLAAAGAKYKKTGKRSVEKAKTAQSPLHLQAMLEAQLPQVVASRMGQGGALVYRSGRFANSVEPTAVMVGPRGGVQVDYTYDKFPYQTFEPGFKQGSTQRDPRKIIGESVRAIAQSIIGDKFLKVRRV
jgi:hypothetical protein